MPTTSRGAFPYPLSSAAADVPADMAALANQAATLTLLGGSGLLSARPTPAAADVDRYYFATDNGLFYRWSGSAWVTVNPVDAAAGIGSMRTLGVSSTQAAAGDTGLVTGDYIVSGAPTRAAALLCDGTSYLRATWPSLHAAINQTIGTFTVTLASPGVFTKTAHGLAIGDPVFFTTTGGLPTGLTANTIYYVMTVPTADTFTVGTTRTITNGVPVITVAVNTSVTQSGTHTLILSPHGIADSTHFNVPDLRGRSLVGVGAGSGLTARTAGGRGGEETHTLTLSEFPSHQHGLGIAAKITGASTQALAGGGPNVFPMATTDISDKTGPVGSGTDHNTMMPWAAGYIFIKT